MDTELPKSTCVGFRPQEWPGSFLRRRGALTKSEAGITTTSTWPRMIMRASKINPKGSSIEGICRNEYRVN